MPTITIPKNLLKEKELVLIPRRKYEEFLCVFKKKKYGQLDKDLDEAIEEVRQGKTVGPFCSVKELKKSLEK